MTLALPNVTRLETRISVMFCRLQQSVDSLGYDASVGIIQGQWGREEAGPSGGSADFVLDHLVIAYCIPFLGILWVNILPSLYSVGCMQSSHEKPGIRLTAKQNHKTMILILKKDTWVTDLPPEFSITFNRVISLSTSCSYFARSSAGFLRYDVGLLFMFAPSNSPLENSRLPGTRLLWARPIAYSTHCAVSEFDLTMQTW